MNNTIDNQINARNKSLKNSVHNRRTGRWSFDNSTVWINEMKAQLRNLHFERLSKQNLMLTAQNKSF